MAVRGDLLVYNIDFLGTQIANHSDIFRISCVQKDITSQRERQTSMTFAQTPCASARRDNY